MRKWNLDKTYASVRARHEAFMRKSRWSRIGVLAATLVTQAVLWPVTIAAGAVAMLPAMAVLGTLGLIRSAFGTRKSGEENIVSAAGSMVLTLVGLAGCALTTSGMEFSTAVSVLAKMGIGGSVIALPTGFITRRTYQNGMQYFTQKDVLPNKLLSMHMKQGRSFSRAYELYREQQAELQSGLTKRFRVRANQQKPTPPKLTDRPRFYL